MIGVVAETCDDWNCDQVALFMVDTVDPDWPNFSCAKDLGGLLATSSLIRWPPRVQWIGPGDRISGEAYERRLDDVVAGRTVDGPLAASCRCAGLRDGMGTAIG